MPTIRQQMIAVLSKGEFKARELSQMLGIREREVYAHLPHIARSVSNQKRQLIINPSRCLSCGYVFSKRQRFTRPGRCARCKHERLSEPGYQVLKSIPESCMKINEK
ncbi:transcriptional regulator [Thermodesulfobacteriota bacterium]